jgi:hypothetical protein
MPEAGLSVPRGQARRAKPRHDGTAREASPADRYDGPRPVRAGAPVPSRSRVERDSYDPRRAAADPRRAAADPRRAAADPSRAAAARATRAREAVASGRISDAYEEALSRRAPANRPVRASARAPDRRAPGMGVPGRRTVTIQGRPSDRYAPKRRPTRRPHERAGFKPDRVALWAVLLGFLLVLVAATSSHGAVLDAHAVSTLHHLAAH